LERVVRQLDLLNDPAFNPPPAGNPLPVWWAALLRRIDAWRGAAPATGLNGDGGAAALSLPVGRDLDHAVSMLGRDVSVSNEGGAYTIRIRVVTADPGLSARIANTLAQVYLDEQEQEKAETRASATAWLAGRLKDLRAAVLKSDAALESYRARHQLGEDQGKSMLDARINEINSAIVAAQTRYSRAQAELDAARSAYRRGEISDTGVVLASPTVQTLRQQESDLLIRQGQLTQTLGALHPQRLEVEAQLDAVRAKLKLEIERVLTSLRSDASAAQADLTALEGRLTTLDQQRNAQAPSEVGLADLEREARSNRDVYDQFLKQFNTVVAQESGQSPDARLADPARPPLEPSAPRRKILLLGAGFCAFCIGALLALAIGLWRGGFATAAALEEATGLPTLEAMPELSRAELAQMLTTMSAPPAAGSIQTLALALAAQFRGMEGGTLLLVTSALPGEGKSMLSLTLARALAQAGRRVLLVDIDLWRPLLTRLIKGLSLQPSGREANGALIYHDPAIGLELAVPSGPKGAGPTMKALVDLLAAARSLGRDYDLVVLDGPPVLTTPNVLVAADEADATVLAVRFEATRASQVQLAIRKLASIGVTPFGTVLTRVSARNHGRYGYGRLSYTRAS
jgi:uncharacterized protein involved in exopolysaccharide biosynthesis/Mrp family chromosome partitioning ATPase